MRIKKYLVFVLIFGICLSCAAIQALAADYYTITFDSNGGSSVEAQQIPAGEKAKEPEKPVFEGHTFLYWEDKTGLFGFNNLMIDEDITLTAKWVENDDWENPYTDVPYLDVSGIFLNSDYFNAKWATINGIVNGTSATTFEPKKPITRAMFVTMLYRYDNSTKAENITSFVDVPAASWYADSVAWAAASGIIKGVDDQHFAPDKILSSEELTVIIYRFADYKGKSTEFSFELEFENESDISPWAKEAYKRVTARLMFGYTLPGENGFLPCANQKQQVTRVQSCIWLQLLDEKIFNN